MVHQRRAGEAVNEGFCAGIEQSHAPTYAHINGGVAIGMQVIDRADQATGGVRNDRVLIVGKTPCDVWADYESLLPPEKNATHDHNRTQDLGAVVVKIESSNIGQVE
jgi:hypothetical protein